MVAIPCFSGPARHEEVRYFGQIIPRRRKRRQRGVRRRKHIEERLLLARLEKVREQLRKTDRGIAGSIEFAHEGGQEELAAYLENALEGRGGKGLLEQVEEEEIGKQRQEATAAQEEEEEKKKQQHYY
jgi:hypothetical protein